MWTPICLVSLLFACPAQGKLMPSGTIAIDCGNAQSFTCDVSATTTGNPVAGWTTEGLMGISTSGSNGAQAANNNPRITTSTGGNVPVSTIIISNFTEGDSGGSVQCVNTDDVSGTVLDMVTVTVGK
jgi:hypothetical protein